MLVSAPVLSDPDWIYWSDLVVHTFGERLGWYKVRPYDLMYLWSSFSTVMNSVSSDFFHVSLNHKVPVGIVTQPPIPIVSSVAKASAAASMLREQKRMSGMTQRSGSNDWRVQSNVLLDSLESFRLSALGSRIRTQTCLSIGISRGIWSLDVMEECLNSAILVPIGRCGLLDLVMELWPQPFSDFVSTKCQRHRRSVPAQ